MDRAIAPYHKRYRTHRSWVFLNFPAAWVHHLKKPASEASQPPRP
jgi:hypothetical protein